VRNENPMLRRHRLKPSGYQNTRPTKGAEKNRNARKQWKIGLGSAKSLQNMMAKLFICVSVMLLLAIPVWAQDDAVTDDDVNAVAHQMYCPVCENIPLDVCPTEACAQWRAEIRAGLESGKTGDEIITEFVGRYGDRVVGTPQDPTLRALSLVTPWLIGGVIALGAAFLLVRWWRGRGSAAVIAPMGGEAVISDDDYRARIERDLQARR
jgi:cytochrome c-type biogenesis protein CcmH